MKAENEAILVSLTKILHGHQVRPLILGDAAYPLKKWLMKPYPKIGALTQEQIAYNLALSKARVVVETCFGRLKSRWRCLNKCLMEHISQVPLIITDCCILNNICILQCDEWGEQDNDDNDGDNDHNKNDHGGNPAAVATTTRQANTDYLA